MANSQLDHYIESIEARLKNLPPARRQEEMQEIRQHLEALVAGHRIAGLSDDEAVEAAIHQFGHSEQIGQELSKTSQPRRMSPLWLFLVYFLTAALILVIFAINDSPYTGFERLLMAFSLPAAVLALGVAEIIQNYLRSRNNKATIPNSQ